MTKAIRKPGFWFILILLALLTVPQYSETLGRPAFLVNLTDSLGLSRHALERILYLAPIIWAGFLFGMRGAILVSAVALVCMLPRSIFLSPSPADALFETGAVFVVGNVIAFTFDLLRKERTRRTHLATLNELSRASSQSLEVDKVLKTSIESIASAMNSESALIYLSAGDGSRFVLSAYKGISDESAAEIDSLEAEDAGPIIQSGPSVLTGDTSRNAGWSSLMPALESPKCILGAPLKSKGNILGLLFVVYSSQHEFSRDEISLVSAISNQIGIAVDNARLYEQQRDAAEQIRQSEEKYRQLFDDAHDAIWLHDLDGRILVANSACVNLTGYPLDELRGRRMADLLTPESQAVMEKFEDGFLKDPGGSTILEITLVRKDGRQACLQLATSLLLDNERPAAFQHIARDITEERRMKDNLRYYLGQVTRAQEEERKRISRELHDDTIQALIVLARQLDDLAEKSPSEERRQQMEKLWQQANAIMDGVRRLSQDLRPAALDQLGLLPALEWLASDIAKHSDMEIIVTSEGKERRIGPEVELVLFRIVQEALRNAWRHSDGTRCEIGVVFGESNVRITVCDNGKGFEPQDSMGDLVKNGRLGLAGMHERVQMLNGTLKVESEPGRGTKVTAEAAV
ncbi:MAG: PAS domain S-box protein [Dehalococcoidia bacterium]|nr:PAS domain S-box protein [Dehalococcoidia bacterium]